MSLADELLADFEELQQQHNDDFKKSRLIADKTQASNDTTMDSANSVFSDLLLIWGRPQLKSVLEVRCFILLFYRIRFPVSDIFPSVWTRLFYSTDWIFV